MFNFFKKNKKNSTKDEKKWVPSESLIISSTFYKFSFEYFFNYLCDPSNGSILDSFNTKQELINVIKSYFDSQSVNIESSVLEETYYNKVIFANTNAQMNIQLPEITHELSDSLISQKVYYIGIILIDNKLRYFVLKQGPFGPNVREETASGSINAGHCEASLSSFSNFISKKTGLS